MEKITGRSYGAQDPVQMRGLPCLEAVFVCIYSCASFGYSSLDVPWNHSVVPLLSMFLPKFYCGSLGMHPTSVNENVFMQPNFSITYQQLNAVLPTPHPTVRIYNINRLLLSSHPHHKGVYICVGHWSNSSQWALAWEWAGGGVPGPEQSHLQTGTQHYLSTTLVLTPCLTLLKQVILGAMGQFDKLGHTNLLAI